MYCNQRSVHVRQVGFTVKANNIMTTGINQATVLTAQPHTSVHVHTLHNKRLCCGINIIHVHDIVYFSSAENLSTPIIIALYM